MWNKLFIVAEIGANHMGSYSRTLALVMAAKKAGADAVKFQTYTPDEIAADVMIMGGPWDGQSYHYLYDKCHTPWAWHAGLFEFARSIGITPFSSPFSEAAVERLETLDCPIYKIASPEIIHLPLIAAAAQTGKPLIISTGMAELSEIYTADEVARAYGATDITYLHCLSAYPAKAEDFNLETMVRLKHHNFKIGLSDHCLDPTATIAAVALGATVIEKHLTLADGVGGPDTQFSLIPVEFMAMVKACRTAAAAIGEVRFGCRDSEKTSYQYRRSIWLVKDVKRGHVMTEDDMAILRPNYGAKPACFDIFVGMKARQNLKAGTPLQVELLE